MTDDRRVLIKHKKVFNVLCKAKHLPALMPLFYTKRREFGCVDAAGFGCSLSLSLWMMPAMGAFFIFIDIAPLLSATLVKARKTLSIFIAINQQHISFRKFYISPINLYILYLFQHKFSTVDICPF